MRGGTAGSGEAVPPTPELAIVSHQGYRLNGRTPAEALFDELAQVRALPLAPQEDAPMT